MTMAERVNHPAHYNAGGIECIDALEAATIGLEGIEAFCTANAIKYLWRWKRKNGGRAYLREHGLTLCADGLRRLIIPKNGGNEEMKYKVCDHCGAHLDNGETCDCRNTNNDGGEPKDKQKERKNDNDGN